jgi:hypothetical protein
MDETTRANLVAFYSSRARGEATTALAFGHIIEDLNRQAGCQDLVHMAAKARDDEIRHAKTCADLAQSYADEPLPPIIPRGTRPFVFQDASDSDQCVLRTIFGCCFGETIAVQWLTDARKLCTDEGARLENRQHLADEVQHSRVGWSYLSAPVLGARERSLIRCFVPQMAQLSLELWTRPEQPTPSGLDAFGCPDDARTEASARRALSEVILPGLELHGCWG